MVILLEKQSPIQLTALWSRLSKTSNKKSKPDPTSKAITLSFNNNFTEGFNNPEKGLKYYLDVSGLTTDDYRLTTINGEVSERLKEQPWKGCVGLVLTAGSNPALSVLRCATNGTAVRV